jgi:cytochrome c556
LGASIVKNNDPMRTTLLVATCLLLLFSLGVSCSEGSKECSNPDDQVQKPLNPNGDSELALLMRAMFDEAQRIKQQIANNEPVTLTLDHEKILTAHATEPAKAASEEYKAFAAAYLQNIKTLETANADQVAAVYDGLVANCMTCHKALCPGPMVRIKKLQ